MRLKIKTQISKFRKEDLGAARIPWCLEGRVQDVVGTIVEARLPKVKLGTITEIEVKGRPSILAEVVGFRKNNALLLPFSNLAGITPEARIFGHGSKDSVVVGEYLLGQVIDPFLGSLDSKKLIPDLNAELFAIDKDPPNPMERARISECLPLGIRAIDGLLTFGQGQRIGIMAGSGVGKSVLMGMIARGSASDINIIGLIGERGREVREFIERDLGEEGLKRSIVVVVTSDQSPLLRIRGAKVVTAIAEYFASKNKKVLLMMDSLTRVAQAQREIGLAVGEPPTAKGYPPSVYSLLPRLLERCGPQKSGNGSISGLFTVLVDGDDFNDPIPDAARAILDGHIVLSRALSAKGHYPAIEVQQSVSRVMNDISSNEQRKMAQRIKTLLAIFEENYDLVQLGSYHKGSNEDLDIALELMPQIRNFLKQDVDEKSNLVSALNQLKSILLKDPKSG